MLREGIPEKRHPFFLLGIAQITTHTHSLGNFFTFVFAPPPNLGNAQKKMFVLLLGFLPKVGIGYFQLLLHFSHKRHKTAPQLHCCCTSWTAVLLFSPQKTKKCQNLFGIPSLGRDWLLCCSLFSCPGQLNRWPCHSLTHSVSEWVRFWFQRQVYFSHWQQ